MMAIEVNKPCIICGSPDSDTAYEMRFPSFGYPGVFVMRRCRGCGLFFNSPRLSPDELKKHYTGDYYFFHRNDAAEFKRVAAMYQRTIALIENTVADKRLLEIGSAKGYLLALLNKLGWAAEGVEISPEAGDYARKTFAAQVFTGTLEDYARSGKTFPVVAAIDVIEHVPDPAAFLALLAKTVERNGILIVDTPNGDSKNMRAQGGKWKGFNPFHIYVFSPKNLENILQKQGFTLEQEFSYGNVVTQPEPEPPRPNKIKQVAKNILMKTGLYGTVQKIRGIENSPPTPSEIETYLADTIKWIEENGTYIETPDASSEFAPTMEGDNIVIIARKI